MLQGCPGPPDPDCPELPCSWRGRFTGAASGQPVSRSCSRFLYSLRRGRGFLRGRLNRRLNRRRGFADQHALATHLALDPLQQRLLEEHVASEAVPRHRGGLVRGVAQAGALAVVEVVGPAVVLLLRRGRDVALTLADDLETDDVSSGRLFEDARGELSAGDVEQVLLDVVARLRVARQIASGQRVALLIGAEHDVPAGDIGVGAREIGFLFGQYKRLKNVYEGVLTGKGMTFGGSFVRTEATGYGLAYFMEEMLGAEKKDFAGKKVTISGSGNVAIYAAQKVQQLGGKVVAMSDSNGYIYDQNGIDIEEIKKGKEIERKRISQCYLPNSNTKYAENCFDIWYVKCDIALPCATENEIDKKAAETLVLNGCIAVGEGANMPCTPEAIEVFLKNKVLYAPGKAANAGGVATSGLEMSQNVMRTFWTFEEVDAKLKTIMQNIYKKSSEAAERYGHKGNLMVGANIAGFEKVAHAMLAQGIV